MMRSNDRSSNRNFTIHATLVSVDGINILINGEAGSGKSLCALKLLKDGHGFIADDVVEISILDGEVFGKAPLSLQGVLEVRGLGLIDVRRVFGVQKVGEPRRIDFVVHLRKLRSNNPEPVVFDLPTYLIEPRSASDAALFIEVAVRAFKIDGAMISPDAIVSGRFEKTAS